MTISSTKPFCGCLQTVGVDVIESRRNPARGATARCVVLLKQGQRCGKKQASGSQLCYSHRDYTGSACVRHPVLFNVWTAMAEGRLGGSFVALCNGTASAPDAVSVVSQQQFRAFDMITLCSGELSSGRCLQRDCLSSSRQVYNFSLSADHLTHFSTA